jgi:hypothetical protein
MSVQTLEKQLDSFDPQKRLEALKALIATGPAPAATGENVNMHIHTFFSYNAEGWSPSHVAWGCRQKGLYAAGIIDFDVIDGMDEFFHAGELLGLRTNVGVETRVFYREYADKEIDSPGEPGVHYIDAVGFTKHFPKGSPQAVTLAAYRQNAQDRNIALVGRINPHVPDIAVNYAKDVLPLVPTGSATERHIIAAYVNKSLQVFTGDKLISYWADLLGTDKEKAAALLKDRPTMEDKVRSKLAKRGGFGYEQPSEKTFPLMEDFCSWVKSCDAIPMESWLDGTSAGEKDAKALLECSVAKGTQCFSIVPDRNWNIKDPEQKALKVANLRKVVQLCDAMELPINIGTEMNKGGLPFVDDLAGPVLSEFKRSFIRGAQVMVGHATCARFADFAYVSDAAANEFKSGKARNDFFAAAGALPPADVRIAEKLRTLGPAKARAAIFDSVKNGTWKI